MLRRTQRPVPTPGLLAWHQQDPGMRAAAANGTGSFELGRRVFGGGCAGARCSLPVQGVSIRSTLPAQGEFPSQHSVTAVAAGVC